MADRRAFTVFEIVNEKRHEIFASFTADPIFQMTDALRRRPPEPIKHWDFNDVGTIRSIEFHMSEQQAMAFLADYIKTNLPSGWRFITERA